MARRMLIDATQPEETRVVVISGNKLEELDFEIASRQQLKGNIYLAKITRVEPSLQAAFVEYGGNRHGFLAFSEIHQDYYRLPMADRAPARPVLGDDPRKQTRGLTTLLPPEPAAGEAAALPTTARAAPIAGGWQEVVPAPTARGVPEPWPAPVPVVAVAADPGEPDDHGAGGDAVDGTVPPQGEAADPAEPAAADAPPPEDADAGPPPAPAPDDVVTAAPGNPGPDADPIAPGADQGAASDTPTMAAIGPSATTEAGDESTDPGAQRVDPAAPPDREVRGVEASAGPADDPPPAATDAPDPAERSASADPRFGLVDSLIEAPAYRDAEDGETGAADADRDPPAASGSLRRPLAIDDGGAIVEMPTAAPALASETDTDTDTDAVSADAPAGEGTSAAADPIADADRAGRSAAAAPESTEPSEGLYERVVTGLDAVTGVGEVGPLEGDAEAGQGEPAGAAPDAAGLDEPALAAPGAAPGAEDERTGPDEVSACDTVEEIGGSDGDDEALDETLEEEEEEEEPVPRRRPLKHYKIQEVIKRRQIVLVQVTKEERGNKGAALTTYLSLPGRYCVLMPNTDKGGGISRKITNPQDRKRLKELLHDLDVPAGMAVIVRTAGLERSKAEIKRDLEYLLRLWDNIREMTLQSTAPELIYEEANLIKRSIRDLYTNDIDEILVEGEDGYRTAKDFMRMLMPSHAKRVQPYRDETIPLFHRYQVEGQIEAIHSPEVQLRSGGYIVINPTEALVAIDVNSGRSTRERNIEETALKTNLEASDEIARQLRLRDLAGLIVVDFIDMEDSRNVAAVERRLREAMKGDRARIQIGRISPFGLLELSRQRLRPSLLETNFERCAICSGTGVVRSLESSALKVLRAIEEEGVRKRSSELKVQVPTAVALYILNQKRQSLIGIEVRYGLMVTIENDDTLIAPDLRLERLRARPIEDDAAPTVSPERIFAETDRHLRLEAQRAAAEAEAAADEAAAAEEAGAVTDLGRDRDAEADGAAPDRMAASAAVEAPAGDDAVRPATGGPRASRSRRSRRTARPRGRPSAAAAGAGADGAGAIAAAVPVVGPTTASAAPLATATASVADPGMADRADIGVAAGPTAGAISPADWPAIDIAAGILDPDGGIAVALDDDTAGSDEAGLGEDGDRPAKKRRRGKRGGRRRGRPRGEAGTELAASGDDESGDEGVADDGTAEDSTGEDSTADDGAAEDGVADQAVLDDVTAAENGAGDAGAVVETRLLNAQAPLVLAPVASSADRAGPAALVDESTLQEAPSSPTDIAEATAPEPPVEDLIAPAAHETPAPDTAAAMRDAPEDPVVEPSPIEPPATDTAVVEATATDPGFPDPGATSIVPAASAAADPQAAPSTAPTPESVTVEMVEPSFPTVPPDGDGDGAAPPPEREPAAAPTAPSTEVTNVPPPRPKTGWWARSSRR